MANHKSAIKRNRQNIKRRAHNRNARSKVRAAIKKARAAIAANDPSAAQAVREAEQLIAKAATKGLFHPKNASRKVSRLTLAASKVAAK